MAHSSSSQSMAQVAGLRSQGQCIIIFISVSEGSGFRDGNRVYSMLWWFVDRESGCRRLIAKLVLGLGFERLINCNKIERCLYSMVQANASSSSSSAMMPPDYEDNEPLIAGQKWSETNNAKPQQQQWS